MHKILSQDEINALFAAMSSDDQKSRFAGSEKSANLRRIVTYDFHRADRISQDQLRSLHQLHDYFARNFSTTLSTYLRAFVEVNLIAVDQIFYSEFLKLLPDPTLFSSIGMRPLDSNIALEINPSLLFPMIDILLGGSGTLVVNERSLTEIEMNISEGVIKLAMRILAESWRPIMELEFFLEEKGTKPQMIQIASAGETVVVVGLEIKVAENVGTMNICIPSRILKVIRNKFDQQWNMRRQKSEGSEAEKILALLQCASLTSSGELRGGELTVGDLLEISVGDVIQLHQDMADTVTLCINGIPKFLGRIVLRRGKRSFEIARKLIAW